MAKLRAQPEVHINGLITIENIPEHLAQVGDLGIQISIDGRIWICINGTAFLRFRPNVNYTLKAMEDIDNPAEK